MAHEEKSPEQLRSENESLRKELREYQSLKEDLMARRVTEKVTDNFSYWMKIVGLVVSIATTIGVGVIVGYVFKFSKAEIKNQVDTMVPGLVSNLAPERVSTQVLAQLTTPEMKVFMRQQVLIQLSLNKPTGIITSSGVVSTNDVAAETSLSKFEIDYSEHMMPVRDQGQEGSVVGMACAAALEYQIFKSTGENVAISPRYIYNMVRKRENTLYSDAGAQMNDAFDFLVNNGAVDESAWPYKPGEFTNEPPAAVAKAKRYYITKTLKLDSETNIIIALRDGPVVVGITIYNSFTVGESANTTGLISMPGKDDFILGGHAICIVGFDSQKQLFKFKNSWGPKWGDQGYGYLPFHYIERYGSGDTWAFKYRK